MKLEELLNNCNDKGIMVEIAEETPAAKLGKVIWTGTVRAVPNKLLDREYLREEWIPDDWQHPFGDGENPETGKSRLLVKPE